MKDSRFYLYCCIISTLTAFVACLHASQKQYVITVTDRLSRLDRKCNSTFDKVFDREIAPRLGPGQHYLDYTGSSLYLNSQATAITEQLQSAVFGNPHSFNPSSQRTTLLVESLREDILRFFNADPEKYVLVFTRSATGGLQAIGESFPWTEQSRMAYLRSNHNSVVGIREYAIKASSQTASVTEQEVEDWLHPNEKTEKNPFIFCDNDDGLSPILTRFSTINNKNASSTASQSRSYSLFAYPAQDNYAGVLYPLNWVKQVQSKSTRNHRWLVLLDVAAYVPTHRLDLRAVPADFICISFYKMFGIPTGAGALIMPKDVAGNVLQRTYWAGGSAFTATSRLHWEARRDGAERWEDGTIPFLDILALRQGMTQMAHFGGIESVESHVSCVKAHLGKRLADLMHSNGAPMIRLFGKHFIDQGMHQGGVANFHILKPDGSVFSYKLASVELASAGFHVREGCMCNPGACYGAVGVADEEVKAYAESKHGEYTDWEWITVKRDGRDVVLPLGSIRVSLGWMSRVADVDALVEFLANQYKDRMDDGVESLKSVELQEEMRKRKEAPHHHYWSYGC